MYVDFKKSAFYEYFKMRGIECLVFKECQISDRSSDFECKDKIEKVLMLVNLTFSLLDTKKF